MKIARQIYRYPWETGSTEINYLGIPHMSVGSWYTNPFIDWWKETSDLISYLRIEDYFFSRVIREQKF